MRAGELRNPIVHSAYATGVVDSYNEDVRTYTDVQTLWGSLQDLSGGEAAYYKTVSPEVTSLVVIRNTSLPVKPYDRLLIKGVTYEIVSVLDKEGRGREQLLGVKKVVAP